MFGHFVAFGTTVFSFQAFSPATGPGQFSLGLPYLFLYLFLIDFLYSPGSIAGIGPTIAAATLAGRTTGATGIPLDRNTTLSRRPLIAAAAVSGSAMSGSPTRRVIGSSTSATVIFFLDRNPLPLSFFFSRGFGAGFVFQGQFYFFEALRPLPLLRLYIFYHRGCLPLFCYWRFPLGLFFLPRR